ncbi:DUF3310 domain-containing protein [Streptomyces sp. ET3-23]|uniref:DUF3310 domain-containing protein n=1 Tax=Streptomyces sp. ET3-23 TaxID=2885643 RepID=UPI001D0F94CC|nr:DUF3310 domain-containing protein [Streptomyces sp. ET3-23]MCC2279539.1 DUF3310 domain-containing protein [Streptomyces sp. ET3-23]
MARFKVGDEVIVVARSGQVASWLYEDKRGVVQAVHEGQPYPNDVQLRNGGALCFTDDELMPAVESNPGRRLLNETGGLALGVDTYKAQEVMKAALSPSSSLAPPTSTVNHPAHYTSHPSGIECIEITKHMNFPLGNAIKYLWRADLKGNAVEDLEKAKRYIEIEIERIQGPK